LRRLRFLHLPSVSVLCLLEFGFCPGCLHCRFLLGFGYLGILRVADADEFLELDLEGILDCCRGFRFRFCHAYASRASVQRNLNPMGGRAA
jgi:hypothetical protein